MTQVFSRLGQRLEPLHGLLNHGALAIQRQNLLGVGAAGTGPEARTAASGKNHRTKIDWLRHRKHILLDKHYVCTVLIRYFCARQRPQWRGLWSGGE